MERIAKIAYVCDNYTEKVYVALKEKIESRYSAEKGYSCTMTSFVVDGTDNLDELINRINGFNVVVVNLGFAEGVGGKVFNDLKYDCLMQYLQNNKIRTILVNQPSVIGKKDINKEISNASNKYKFRLANVSLYCKQAKAVYKNDDFTSEIIDIYVRAITPVLIRTKMLVLWQYNGRYAHCNYSCPYCYVATSVNKGMHIVYDLNKWEEAFTRHFGETDTVFYFSYGEPTMGGKAFYDALEMIARHPNWQVRMTTNVSISFDRLLNTTLAKEGRLNINASFHPTQVSIEKFIEQCNAIRNAGIEPSIIYVMYPEQIDDFENKYLPAFNEHGYRVHIRAFRGLYKGKKYPQAYTKEQWEKTARYMDMGNFKYQLPAVNGLGRLSMLGVSHILGDNYGKIEMCDSYVGDRHYGNVFDEEINLDLEPHPFPGLVPLAAVDDIADYVELDYDDLVNNNVNDFNTQGGTVKNPDGSIEYPLLNVDFSDKKIVNELSAVPKAFKPAYKYWFNPKWFCRHFIYSYVIKKYGKYVFAWFGGKFRLLKQGKLSFKNFWHS